MTAPIPCADYLVVGVGEQYYGLPSPAVITVVTPRPLAPLPFVPACVDGLVSINERIVLQVDLHALLDSPAVEGGELVLVESPRSPCALRVTRIAGKAELEAEALQSLAEESGLPVCARFTWSGHSVMVLDLERIAAAITDTAVPAGEEGLLGQEPTAAEALRADTLGCLVVRVGAERFAIPLVDLLEVLDLPRATAVPGAPREVEGHSLVRDDVLLVLSLPALLAIPADTGAGNRPVVVMRHGEHRLGLRVDALEGIRELERSSLRAIEEAGSDLAGVLAMPDGVLGFLTAARLLPAARLQSLLPLLPAARARDTRRDEVRHPVLHFRLGDEGFGIALGLVRRIADYCAPDIVRAEGDERISGAVNINGQVLPVLEMARALRVPGENTGAWLIVGDDEAEWAVAVHEATGIVLIPESGLERRRERGGLVQAVATVEGRLMSLLDLAPLMAVPAVAPAA